MEANDFFFLLSDKSSSRTILLMLIVFFALVAVKVLFHFPSLFLDTRGWSHRLAGSIHFCWLLFGAAYCWVATDSIDDSPIVSTTRSKTCILCYDIILGCSGVVTTLTASRDFPHRHVRNNPGQSGTLHRKAMVTQSEMIEHSFYQGGWTYFNRYTCIHFIGLVIIVMTTPRKTVE